MGVIQRQGIRASIWNYVGVVFGYLLVVWLFPKYLTQEEFGLTRVLVSIGVIVAEFGRLGLPYVVVRYFPFYKENQTLLRSFNRFTFLLAAASGAVVIVGLLIFKDVILSGYQGADAALLSKFYLFLIPMLLGMLFSEVLYSYARSVWKAAFPSFVKEVMVRGIQFLGLALLIIDRISFEGFMFFFVASYLMQPIVMAFYLIPNGVISMRGVAGNQIKRSPILKYGLTLALNKIPGVALNQLDVVMLSFLAGIEASGKYAIAFFIAEIIRIPGRNLIQAALPAVAESWKTDDMGRIKRVYRQSALALTSVSVLLFIGIIGNIEFIESLLEQDYRGIASVVLFIGLSKVFDLSCGINGGIISTSRFYRFDLISNVTLLLLAIVLNVLLIPPYGIEGAAVATAIAIFINNSLKVLFVWWKFGIQPFTVKGVAIMGLGGLLLAITYIIPNFQSLWANLAINTTIIVVLFVAGLRMLGVHKSLKLGSIRDVIKG